MLPTYVDVSRSSEGFRETSLTVYVFSSSLSLFAGLGLPEPSQAIFVSARVVAFADLVLVALRCGMIGQDNAYRFPVRLGES